MKKSVIGIWQRYLKHMPMFGESLSYQEKRKLLDVVVFYVPEVELPKWLAWIDSRLEKFADWISAVRRRTIGR